LSEDKYHDEIETWSAQREHQTANGWAKFGDLQPPCRNILEMKHFAPPNIYV